MRIACAFVLFCLLFLTACGVKGNLQPKGTPEPMPVINLNVRQQGDSVLLNWVGPTSNQDGSPLTDLDGFLIGLYSYAPGNFCPECRDQEILATIDADNPYPARVFNRTYYLRSTDITVDAGFRYRVIPYTESGKNGPASDVRLTVKKAPDAPVDVRSEQLDRAVKLFWTLSGGIQDAGELLGVNIYRGSGEGLEPEPINPTPVKGNNFDDFGLNNGTSYRYGLRTVVESDGTVVESVLSELAIATPQAGL